MEPRVFTCVSNEDILRFRAYAADQGAFIHCMIVLPMYGYQKAITGYQHAIIYTHDRELQIEVKTVGGAVPLDQHAAVMLNTLVTVPYKMLPKADQQALMQAALNDLPNIH